MPPALLGLALSVLPALAEWLGGARAGDVAERASKVVRDVTGTEDPLAAAAAMSDPGKYAEIQVRLGEIAGQERDAFLADVANARAQTIALASSGSAIAWAAPVISTVITVGFFGAVFLMLVFPQAYDERTAVLVNIVLAALTLGFAQVTNYWLGSSSGSKRSGDAVREMATRVITPAAAPSVAIATTGPVTADTLNDASLAAARGGR